MLSIFDTKPFFLTFCPNQSKWEVKQQKNIYLLGDKKGNTYNKMLSYRKIQDSFPT